jgi:SAM-dependent methyltransferase
MHVIHQQLIHVEDSFKDEDRIIDLGGGGEGVIGRLRGAQVTAVDIRQQELDDARRLPFPDRSFDAATAFFFLMYVPGEDRSKVLKGAYRVLRPGGTLQIWDASIPPQGTRRERLFVVPVKVKLPRQTIATGYGAPWKGREMSCAQSPISRAVQASQ